MRQWTLAAAPRLMTLALAHSNGSDLLGRKLILDFVRYFGLRDLVEPLGIDHPPRVS